MSLFYLANKEIIANRALTALGSEGLISFEDGTPQAQVVKQIYSTYIQGLLTKGNWSFATTQAQLTQLNITPIAQWNYTFAFPADCLKLRTLYASNQIYVLPLDYYQIFETRYIYTNQQELWAQYINVVDEAQWPYYFIEFAIKALASELAYPITRDLTLREYYRAEAFGSPAENGLGGLYAEAASQDSKQNSNCFLSLNIQQNARNYMGWGFYDGY